MSSSICKKQSIFTEIEYQYSAHNSDEPCVDIKKKKKRDTGLDLDFWKKTTHVQIHKYFKCETFPFLLFSMSPQSNLKAISFLLKSRNLLTLVNDFICVTDAFSTNLLWCSYSRWCQSQERSKRAQFLIWATPGTSSYSMARNKCIHSMQVVSSFFWESTWWKFPHARLSPHFET